MATTNCRTLDDPKYLGQNELLAIDGRGVVLGYDNESYLARPPYRPQDYRYLEAPGGDSLIAGFHGSSTMVGYVSDVNRLKGTWGLFQKNGLWTLLKSRREGGGKNAVTELLAVNAAGSVAGFYLNAHGNAIPFLLGVDRERFDVLHPPGGISAEATALNDTGSVAGFYTASDGSTRGFVDESGAFAELAFPGSAETRFFGIANDGRVVGSYAGASGQTHGLLLENPMGTPQWQALDFPDASGTVARGINSKGEIAGGYTVASGATHGFLCKER